MPERRGLLEVARDRIRSRHMAYRTEQTYLQWMRRFIKSPTNMCSRSSCRGFDNITRALRPRRLPVVLSRAEVRSLLVHLDGTSWLIANLLYRSGLRLMEAMRHEIIVRDAFGIASQKPLGLTRFQTNEFPH